jgi:peptidoglycan hydrolase-like protein with peptidoglycan-binding domain
LALKSKLFAGDARVEAIAYSDAQNVKYGDRGEYVRKIQLALNALTGAGLDADGIFGSATQAAVLSFKTARGIINRSYQSAPDAIVGKMTIATLDNELCALSEPSGPITLRVLSPAPPAEPITRDVFASRPLPVLSPTYSAITTGGPPELSSGTILSITSGQSALVEVKNAMGGWINTEIGCFVQVLDPVSRARVDNITNDPQTVLILGGQPQTTKVFFNVLRYLIFKTETTTLTVVVHNPNDPNIIPTMTPHNHLPTHKWQELLGKIEQPTDDAVGIALKGLCLASAEPQTFVDAAIKLYLGFQPIAMKHLNWYLKDGRGADFIENDNIAKWVDADANLRAEVAHFVRVNRARSPKYKYYIYFDASRFSSMDFRNAFGTIDKLFIEFDMGPQTVTLSFKDRYEWHPVCQPYYKKEPDDDIRNTNSLHAALVELKVNGAADYWMLGEATLPMAKLGLP